MSETWLIVGLGNPGPRYARHRHNVGAMVVAELAQRAGQQLRTHKARANAAQVRVGVGAGGVPGPAAVIAVPMTYMNESGRPIAALMSFYGIEPDHLIVVHDELDIPAGEVRLKRGGGEGGHNGLRSTTAALSTKDYYRVRVGIGRPLGRQDPADYVLSDFPAAQRAQELPLLIGEAADAVELLVTAGLTSAQQQVHGRMMRN